MKGYRFAIGLVVLLLLVLALPAGAQEGLEDLEPLSPAPSAETGEMLDESATLWFVEFNSAPTAAGGDPATIRNEHRSFRNAAARAGLGYSERFAFTTLWNGMSIRLNSPAELSKLERIAGVASISPVVTLYVPETTEVPDLGTALAMTGADAAQSELGLTGEGVQVAVMDTGIDYDHPDLGGCFGPGCRVFTGHDFVGDAFNADPTSPTYNPVPVPDDDPDDCQGHGTHVSGIIGANGEVVGVAPGVTFGAYRVFGCEGSTTADIMIAAMEAALADGMDVLNMSIGSAFQWPDYPTAEASDALVNNGVVVVASIGNSGANGLYSAGAPGLGAKVIGVASYDNSHVVLSTFTVNGVSYGYMPATAAPAPPTSGTYPLTRTGTPTSTADACTALPAGSLAGQIALIRRGSCTFHIKSLNAQNAGAVGVVLYNNAPGLFSATVAGTPAITIPVVSVSDASGVALNNVIAAGPTELTWTDQTGTFPNPTGGLISSFSSYGLSPDLALKPDLGAPGGLIRSTYPLEKGAYATLSGTSMSSPHVAGAVALYLQAHPNASAQSLDEVFQNTANPKNWWGNPGLGFLDQVHRQGAGMIDIVQAVTATASVSPSELALGESEAGPSTNTLTITNNGASDVTFTLSHTPALSTNANTNAPGASTGFASVVFSAPSVTVPAGGSATVDVTITANATLPARYQYGGYIVLTAGTDVYRVPYAGFKGDYQSIQVLTPTVNGFPWLASLSGGSYTNQPGGATYTLQGGDVPYILLHLEHQSRWLRFRVVDSAGKSWHLAFEDDYLPRNSTSTGFFAIPWDGTTYTGGKAYAVPDGQYQIIVEVVKALGDPLNPAHTETWTSPMITIDRP